MTWGGARSELDELETAAGMAGISILQYLMKGVMDVMKEKSACRFCSAFLSRNGNWSQPGLGSISEKRGEVLPFPVSPDPNHRNSTIPLFLMCSSLLLVGSMYWVN